ncbi:MAG TPA: cation transporter [Terriglobales bacterium]|nr:cation transporter [Terriglobales bacterium]
MSTVATSPAVRAAAVRRGRRLEYLTILWNSLEALIGIAAGVVAGSIALVGFGVDSVIEVSSGAVLLWRLGSDACDPRAERRERIALKLVGLSFFALALYVAAEAVKALWLRQAPERSPVGIGLAIASLIAMPLLARAKRRVARSLQSGALQADSRQTDLCAYLSAILLGGLVLNAALGWWWADPVAGLAMLLIIVKEGVDAVKGKTCCD